MAHLIISSSSSSSLVFKVTRKEPELITPAKPTPHEFKPLSDIDDQGSYRFQIPFIQFYRNKHNVSMEGRDPVEIIRKAIANVLVFYYPFAGRLREGPGKKLIVDCTDEGVMFIEANADVRFDQFGSSTTLLPPCPWLDELLYEVPGYGGILDCPLLLIQVTRLLCGGFVFAIRLNHIIADVGGLVQFINAVAEMARGVGTSIQSIQPVWQRELLNARVPPRVMCIHRQYGPLPHTQSKPTVATHHSPLDNRSFFFGKQEISALKKHMPSHLRTCSTLEILLACLWKCRTIALDPHPEDEVRLIFHVNVRSIYHPQLPVGFYGNAIACPIAFTTAGRLCKNSIFYALELVKKAKESVTDEYMRSLADMLVTKGRPELEMEMTRTFFVSDVTRAGFGDIDFGWGKPVYGGPAEGGARPYPGTVSTITRFNNDRGENGIVVPICLPSGATMDKFGTEVQRLIKEIVLVGHRHLATKL